MQTKYVRSVNSMTAGTLPQGMENHSAYNIFDLFNAAAPSARTAGGSFFDPFGFFGSLSSEEDGGRRFFRLPEIPENVISVLLKYGNRLAGIPAGRETMDHDFEE